MRMPAMPACKAWVLPTCGHQVAAASCPICAHGSWTRSTASAHQTGARSQLEDKALTSVHILGRDADAVVVVEQRGVAVVWNDVVL